MEEDKCQECGGRLVPQTNGILICEKCGIEQDVSSIDVSFRPMSLKEIVNRHYKKIPKRRWSPDSYSRNRKKLERVARIHLQRDLAEKIISLFRETISWNYAKDIPKTRDKKIVFWVIFIAWVKYVIDASKDNPNLKEAVPSCNKLLSELEKENPNRFKKAMEQVRKAKTRIAPDIRDIDSKIQYIKDEKSFFELFYNRKLDISEERKQENIQEVINAGLLVANIFLRNKIVQQLNKKIKKLKLVSKRNGFFGACCYLVCEKSGLSPQSQEQWARFFHVSPSLFDKALKEIRTTIVEPLDSQEA